MDQLFRDYCACLSISSRSFTHCSLRPSGLVYPGAYPLSERYDKSRISKYLPCSASGTQARCQRENFNCILNWPAVAAAVRQIGRLKDNSALPCRLAMAWVGASKRADEREGGREEAPLRAATTVLDCSPNICVAFKVANNRFDFALAQIRVHNQPLTHTPTHTYTHT